MSGALALSTILLSGCNEPVPSHTVVVQEGQTLDDIGNDECGRTPGGYMELPRRNQLRKFNKLPNNTVVAGQEIKVPDTFCYDTGDRAQ